MSQFKKYTFNPDTLSYESQERSKRSRIFRYAGLFVVSIVMTFVYWWIYTSVLCLDLPKTAILKGINDRWCTEIDLLNRKLDAHSETLSALEMRDDEIYRSLFGMNVISDEVRNAGFGGVNRYSYLDGTYHSGLLKKTVMRIDILTKKSYVQSRSFDEISSVSRRAGDMASCIPAISPVIPDKSVYRLSSSFGFRSDPFTGRLKRHNGLDFALPEGNSVYSTGDGVVVKVQYSRIGYGNNVLIDHGFGYKTRYAHLSSVFVTEGMKVKRGDFLGKTGDSGRSSGPHLHYEVMYMDKYVNPINYIDLDISVGEYSSMIRHSEAESGIVLHPSHRRK